MAVKIEDEKLVGSGLAVRGKDIGNRFESWDVGTTTDRVSALWAKRVLVGHRAPVSTLIKGRS